ncbi:hypothetical protein ACQ4PT_014981 [Festuca glaucescens]
MATKQTVLSTLPQELPLDFLKTITQQFSTDRIIGTGAFGTVYKGIMPDGQMIAVKKLAENSPLARDRAFTNEVQHLMCLQNENIVKLVAFCHEGQKKVVQNNGRYIVADIYESVLCYEYLPMGSLRKNLFEGPSNMTWHTCFKIIKGICNGLLFLHSIHIIHMRLKPEKILLDGNMMPKIAGFGLSRLFDRKDTLLEREMDVLGPWGYIAPEYVLRGEMSTQSDIYSLGLVIIETTTGEKNQPKHDDPSARHFVENVRKIWTDRHIVSMFPRLTPKDLQEVIVCVEIGLECVQIDRKKRPSIENIVERLSRCADRIVNQDLFHRSVEREKEPIKLKYDLIKHITGGFAEERIVGTGAFGIVYRGVYRNGEEIAVKIFRDLWDFDCKKFLKEFWNLRGLKHQNVVKLLGFCNESNEELAMYEGKQVLAKKIHRALIFEYVKNGSLQNHISDESTGLDWPKRYKIIRGICEGLKYLHVGLESPVMHFDLKPDNILLDQEMVPKIADFGLARLFGEENTRKTISSVGTIGYLPPEYIELQVISRNFDIFSLGVIIAKIITGHEGYNSVADMAPTKFVKRVHDKWRKMLVQILKPRALEVYCHQVKKCIEIALECIKRNRQDRPTIQCIVSTLLETETIIQSLGLQANQILDEESTEEKQLLGTVTVLRNFPYNIPLDHLKKMTNDFSDERKIGEDAFGTVYMGTLDNGKAIMAKRLVETPVARQKAFTNELQNIGAIQQKNIIKLVGYNYAVKTKVVYKNGKYIIRDVAEFILCHEYLPQGTLQHNLFEVPSRMDWYTRFKIINGICDGLQFLHQIPIIHMDLKPDTIFLDDDMNPKLASFTLSKLFREEQIRMFTQNIVGSNAYMSPEYLYRGEVSTQSDIYSLGLVIMEIVTGQKNSPRRNDPSARYFIDNVRQEWTLEHIVSVYHSPSYNLLQVKACIDVGLLCVEVDPRARPSVEDIINMLGQRPPTLDGAGPYSDSLFVQPPQLCFLLEPKMLTSRSLYLTNTTYHYIAFRLVTETPRRYLTKLPLCGIVPPNCTYTLCVTMHEHENAPPSNGNNFLSLQTRAVRGKEVEYVDNPDSVTEFIERAGDEVQEVKVTISYELLSADLKQKNQIIDGQNYRQVLSVDMHSTEPWILTSNQRGYACIWNYQTQVGFYSPWSADIEQLIMLYSAKFVEREEWLVVGGGDGYIYVYTYGTMKEVASVGTHGGRRPVTSLAVHPTHSLVLSASDDDTIKLWDWKNDWQCTRTFEWHNNRVTQLMFDPNDNNSFASTSLDGTVKIWNTSSGTCTITLDGHQDGLHCLHYIRGDNRPLLVSGSSDGAAKIWDLQTDSCVKTLNGHTNHLTALWWHPELAVLITGSTDGTVQIWKLTHNTYRLENIIGFNLGSVNDLGYVKTLKSCNTYTYLYRIVVGCEQGVVMMEINLP